MPYIKQAEDKIEKFPRGQGNCGKKCNRVRCLTKYCNVPGLYHKKSSYKGDKSMEIKDMFSKERACFDLKATTKMEVIDELIGILVKDNKISDKEKFKEAVLKREEEFSTGIA